MTFDVMWFISGEWSTGARFLYTGGRLTRREAVEEHCRRLGKDWAYCRRKGDRAVKCRVEPLEI